MAVSIDTTGGLMSVNSTSDNLPIGGDIGFETGTKGFIGVTLKKGATQLASITRPVAGITPGGEQLWTFGDGGPEAAGPANSSTKIDYVLLHGEIYTLNIVVSGNFKNMYLGTNGVLYFNGNGHGTADLVLPFTGGL
jgi:hypothetical protein